MIKEYIIDLYNKMDTLTANLQIDNELFIENTADIDTDIINRLYDITELLNVIINNYDKDAETIKQLIIKWIKDNNFME